MKFALAGYRTTIVVGKKITVRLGDKIHPIACGDEVTGKTQRNFWTHNCDSCCFAKGYYDH